MERDTVIRNIKFIAVFLFISLMIALPTVAFADDEPVPTVPTETVAAPVTPSVPAAQQVVVWDRLAYKMLFIATYGPTCKQERLVCYPPLANVKIRVYDANKKLFKTAVTNDKGRVYISFPQRPARFSMIVSHAPINGKRLATRNFGLRLPFFGRDGVSEFKMYYCLSNTYGC